MIVLLEMSMKKSSMNYSGPVRVDREVSSALVSNFECFIHRRVRPIAL